MRPLARKALETIRNQGGRVVNFDLIETTIQGIGKDYQPGLIRWIKEQPNQWTILLELEGNINKASIAKDEVSLTRALTDYQVFFSEMIKLFQEKGWAK
jgi:hypothetical protein